MMFDSEQVVNKIASIVDPENKLSIKQIIALIEEKFTANNSARVPCPFYDTVDGICYLVLHNRCGEKQCKLMTQHP